MPPAGREARPVGQARQAVGVHLAAKALLRPHLPGAIDQRDQAAWRPASGDPRERDVELALLHRSAESPGDALAHALARQECDDLLAQLSKVSFSAVKLITSAATGSSSSAPSADSSAGTGVGPDGEVNGATFERILFALGQPG